MFITNKRKKNNNNLIININYGKFHKRIWNYLLW